MNTLNFWQMFWMCFCQDSKWSKGRFLPGRSMPQPVSVASGHHLRDSEQH